MISRMLLKSFKVDFESVWVGLELIRARCAARFGLVWDWLWGIAPNHRNQPNACASQSLKQ